MIRLALFGSGVRMSLSKAIYEGLATRLGLRLVYEPVETSKEKFKSSLRAMLDRGLHGFNATKPVKEEAFRSADLFDEHSKAIAAANTFTVRDDGIEAFNTDWIGFLRSLETHDPSGFDRVLVLGAGGAGRAAIYALLREGLASKVYVTSRGGVTAKRAASALSKMGDVEAIEPAEAKTIVDSIDLLVNATPVGWGTGASPIESVPKPPCTVLDMVYRPLYTELLRAAAARGCIAVDGLWMLVFQAAENLRIWLGITADPILLRSIALSSLGGGRVASRPLQE